MKLDISGQQISFIKPKGYSARKTGLLNHHSLSMNEGLMYEKTKFFHTVGMKFPVTVVCIDKKLNFICNPVIIEKNCLFIVPKKTYYTLEMSHEIYSLFKESVYEKK